MDVAVVSVLKAIAAIIGLIGAMASLLGIVLAAYRHYYLKSTPRTWLWAFLGGPLAWQFGDADQVKKAVFWRSVKWLVCALLAFSALLVWSQSVK